VDIVCGPGQIARLVEFVERARAGETVLALDPPRNEPRDERAEGTLECLDLSRDPSSGSAGAQAFVRVARGCDNFCTYCIVPYVRGPERSRAPEAIVEEVRRLVEAGRTDVTLLGQTVNRYRWRDGGREVRFAELLRRVAGIEGLRRCWFVTSHPVDFTDDVLEAMRDERAVCEYIHVPAQSGSDAILRRMNRRYTRAEYDGLIDRARAIVPGVTFAGDFIVGFPGETEDDHAASAELIERTGYKNSFVFKYSPRPGTVAARRLTDDVPEEVKKRRNNELLAVQHRVALAHHRERIGQTVEVHVEGPSTRSTKQPRVAPEGIVQLTGRTRGNHIVVFDAPLDQVGQYLDVEIVDATALTLIGRARGA
jgi:tRNA-2-methylthio-N6-dimethylallyladenosine synthase